MKLFIDNNRFINTSEGIDISIPLRAGSDNVNAWYCEPVSIEPVVAGDFIGDVNQGGSVNFKNIKLNPHGNGTHTECVGHISKEEYTINQCLKEFHFMGQLMTVHSSEVSVGSGVDHVIRADSLKEFNLDCNALLIRTENNSPSKSTKQYSGNNPAYFSKEAMQKVNDWGVKHLMIDLPSVDKEDDGGAVVCHKKFWNYPNNPQLDKTITELIYVDDSIEDGLYLVTIQIMSIESDASPSKIMLYEIKERN